MVHCNHNGHNRNTGRGWGLTLWQETVYVRMRQLRQVELRREFVDSGPDRRDKIDDELRRDGRRCQRDRKRKRRGPGVQALEGALRRDFEPAC